MVKMTILFTYRRTQRWRALFFCSPINNWVNYLIIPVIVLFGQGKVMQYITCITTFLRSINATCESNENSWFSAQLRRAKLMSGREIENVVFLGNTEIFEERKHMAFLLLLRPTYIQGTANLIFQVLPNYIWFFWAFALKSSKHWSFISTLKKRTYDFNYV